MTGFFLVKRFASCRANDTLRPCHTILHVRRLHDRARPGHGASTPPGHTKPNAPPLFRTIDRIKATRRSCFFRIFHGALCGLTEFPAFSGKSAVSTWRWHQQDHRLPWKIAAPHPGMTRCSGLLERPVWFQNFDFDFPKSAVLTWEVQPVPKIRGAFFKIC
jgi:hypothetical protein